MRRNTFALGPAQIQEEIEELRRRLLEAEEVLRAIQAGEVDALVVSERWGEKVYTLRSPDHPYRLMIEEMLQGAVTVTTDGTILYANGCFGEMVRTSGATLAGSPVSSFVAPESRDLFDALLSRQGKSQGEVELLAEDGSRVPAFVAVNSLSLGEDQPVLCLVVTDLTEQKRNEQLVTDEKLARSILDHATEAMVVCDLDGCIVRASREAHRLGGRSVLLESFESAFPVEMRGGEIADARTFVAEILAGRRLRGLEAGLHQGRLALILSGAPLLSAEGVEGCVITLTDITERRRAERDLERAWAEAEAMNLAKDRFLATLSHELRTPLTPVLALASDLERSARLPAELRPQVGMMRRNIELEARLIDDLLDLTRISRGKLELEIGDVDLSEVLEHALQTSCQDEIASGRRRVELRLAEGDHRLRGDGSRLTQVFWNLLNNAVKFTPEGGSITVSTRRDAPSRLCVEVTDSGVGIEPEILPRIFDAFEQGEAGFAHRFAGLGLGLAISRAIVELHGGTILARSAGKGQGTTFEVHLPVGPRPLDCAPEERDAGAAAPQSAVAAAATAPARLRILLVEDHADTATALAELLRLRGHEVTVAGTLAEALGSAEAAGPGGLDLVISDLGLPDGSGQELMRQLSRRFQLRGIALSGYGMEKDIRQSLEAGFARHLTKPVNLQALEAAVQHVLGAPSERRDPERNQG